MMLLEQNERSLLARMSEHIQDSTSQNAGDGRNRNRRNLYEEKRER